MVDKKDKYTQSKCNLPVEFGSSCNCRVGVSSSRRGDSANTRRRKKDEGGGNKVSTLKCARDGGGTGWIQNCRSKSNFPPARPQHARPKAREKEEKKKAKTREREREREGHVCTHTVTVYTRAQHNTLKINHNSSASNAAS